VSGSGEISRAPPDVAISFLARDEPVAADLTDRLAAGLDVFFFPRKQEELAGTNGLESMRTPFQEARVVVVLFRNPWGETPWTRVEQEAITDRFLKQGWKWLLFVQLDNESRLPAWLPDTHVRFALEQYGAEQLAGAIKMRVQELGGQIYAPSALARARQVQSAAELRTEEESNFRDTAWIQRVMRPQLETLAARIVSLAAEINAELNMGIVAVNESAQCVLRAQRVSLNIGWRQHYMNVAGELISAEFAGPIFLPSERKMSVSRPRELGRVTYEPTLSRSRELRWRRCDQETSTYSVEELAQELVSQFLELVRRDGQGQIHHEVGF
jgi:hypothetical protein